MEFENSQLNNDPFFKKMIALKKIFMNFSSKTFVIKDEVNYYKN